MQPDDPSCTTKATNAPNVTISPWAKFDRPVVPKISDSPIEVMAMIIASFKPLASVWGSRLHLLCTSRAVLAEEERTGHVLVAADLGGLLVLAVLDRQTLGQGFGVDANDVDARLGRSGSGTRRLRR